MADRAPPGRGSPVPAAGRERVIAAHRCAIAFYRAHLRNSPAEGYLRQRLRGSLPRGWPIGYAPAAGTGCDGHRRPPALSPKPKCPESASPREAKCGQNG